MSSGRAVAGGLPQIGGREATVGGCATPPNDSDEEAERVVFQQEAMMNRLDELGARRTRPALTLYALLLLQTGVL